MLTVQVSYCGRYIRVTVGTQSVVLPIGEWSRLVARPSSFHHHP